MGKVPKSSAPALRSCAIGLDVGATKIAGGIVTREGRVVARRIIPTSPDRGGEAVLKDALAFAAGLLTEARSKGLDPLGLGVGVAELVDLDGNVVSAQTIRWRGLPIQKRFSNLVPAVIESDSRAAAFCEGMFGAGRDFKSFLYVSVGTGIGCALVLDGIPYAGARGSTGTLASAAMTSVCLHCGKTSQTVLEEIASGPALVSRYNQRSGKSAARGENVLGAAAGGDPDAVEVVQTAGEALGATIAMLVNVVDPEAVIIGGGLGMANGRYWDSLEGSIRRHIWSETHRQLPVLKAGFGVDAGFVGAAGLAYRRLGSGTTEFD